MNRKQIARVAREELNGCTPLLPIAEAVSGMLPDLVGNRLRTALFRAAGVRIGRASVIGGHLTIAGRDGAHRVVVGDRVWINAGCYFDASDRVEIGDDVAIGQHVMLLTQTHEIGDGSRRAAANRTAPVRIGNGCWLGARTTVLPGVTIGAGSLVAAGSVVAGDVAPNTLVAGVPARPVRELP